MYRSAPPIITVSAPGRMCLIGGHQDYFGLPVISAAINKRIRVTMEPSGSDQCAVVCSDVHEQYAFSLKDLPLPYVHKRDYIRSMVNIAYRKGWIQGGGFKAHIAGDIPMQAGVSSSSALCVVWGAALCAFYRGSLGTPAEHALLGFEGEVKEFGEPGGMQDHIASAYGGMRYMDFRHTPPPVEYIAPPKGSFVLGDSLEPKATIEGLWRIKNGVHRAVDFVRKALHTATLANMALTEVEEIVGRGGIDEEAALLLRGTLMTRDLTEEAHRLCKENMDDVTFGQLLNRQHAIFRDYLAISTSKIEQMIQAAKDAGALGCEIVGSGGGGCMLAYAPYAPEKVAAAIEGAGGVPLRIAIDEGARLEVR